MFVSKSPRVKAKKDVEILTFVQFECLDFSERMTRQLLLRLAGRMKTTNEEVVIYSDHKTQHEMLAKIQRHNIIPDDILNQFYFFGNEGLVKTLSPEKSKPTPTPAYNPQVIHAPSFSLTKHKNLKNFVILSADRVALEAIYQKHIPDGSTIRCWPIYSPIDHNNTLGYELLMQMPAFAIDPKMIKIFEEDQTLIYPLKARLAVVDYTRKDTAIHTNNAVQAKTAVETFLRNSLASYEAHLDAIFTDKTNEPYHDSVSKINFCILLAGQIFNLEFLLNAYRIANQIQRHRHTDVDDIDSAGGIIFANCIKLAELLELDQAYFINTDQGTINAAQSEIKACMQTCTIEFRSSKNLDKAPAYLNMSQAEGTVKLLTSAANRSLTGKTHWYHWQHWAKPSPIENNSTGCALQ